MRLRYTDRHGKVVEVEALNALISDNLGNPIVAARQQPGAAVWVTSADHPAFDDLMRAMGRGSSKVQRVLVE